MKAMRLHAPGGLDNFYADSYEAAAPGRDEITVRIRASSLNFHDYQVATGGIPTAEGRIPLCDGAGEVVAAGEDVTEFAVGDMVMSMFFPDWSDGAPTAQYRRRIQGNHIDGFACEQVTKPSWMFTRAPVGLSAMEAATLPCAGLTAWRALFTEGGLRPGELVVTQGTGGVSILALQMAKAAGAKVIATSSSATKLERLRALGADHVINYREDPAWGVAVLDITGGHGADHIIEVGGAGTLDQSMKASRHGGHISIIGVLASREGPISTYSIMSKQLRVIGITVGNRRDQMDMVRGIEMFGMRPVIDRTFALESLADAFRHQEAGRHFGKIGIEI